MESAKSWIENRGYKDSERTKTILFKIGTWIYRRTGFLIGYVRSVQDDFIRKNADKILENWVKTNQEVEDFDLSFGNFMGCEIGCWQGHHRIYTAHIWYTSKIMILKFRIRWFLRKHNIM